MLEEYYFLFFVALIWIIFATVQDLRTREVSNWLNFSLIAFALAYRAFYSSTSGNWNFFIFGLLGFALFFGVAHAFYYARVFAGGDAKLLMALGAVLPFESYSDLALVSTMFIFVLFLVGAVYSLAYSGFLVYRNYRKFSKEFAKSFNKYKFGFLIALFVSIIFLLFLKSFGLWVFILVFLLFVSLLYIYLMALESSCMIKLVKPGRLTEGDWLEGDVRMGRHVIKKSVHGLSWEEIRKLRKFGRKVLIKEGIPFVPAFLITFLITGFFFLVSGFDLQKLVSSLLSLLSAVLV